MSRARCSLLAIALVCLTAPSVGAQAVAVQGPVPGGPGGRRGGGMRDRPDMPTGTATLRGRVVGGESGGPLRRALVHLQGQEVREGKMTTTDEQGRWELKDLPAGRFTLTATKAGYVTLQYGQRRPFEQGRPLDIQDNQTLNNVNFNLPRGSVIAGRINDEFGEPVAEAMVMALRYRYFNGQRRLIPAGRFSQTDDGGNFRIYGLAPGDYYLSATLRLGMFMGGESTNRTGYAPTYFPGTPSEQQAEKVSVALGAEVTGISFALNPVRTARVTGTAVDSQGRPMTGAFVSLMETSGDGGNFMMMSFGGGNRVGENGHFTLTDVSPGEYTITAREMGPGRDGDESETAEAKLLVSGEDISGVSLIGTKGATIKGQVSFDIQQPTSLKPGSVGVYVTPKDPLGSPGFFMGPGNRDTLNDDWTFEMRAMRGPVLLRTGRTPPGYTLKAVYYNNQDVTDSGINFKPGESISGVQVLLTAKSSTVSGSVTDARSQPVTDYAAIIFAEDSAKWGFMSRYVHMARPDQQGAFQVKELPPGRYLAAAVDYLEEGEETNPETLERLRNTAMPFTLDEADTKTLALKVIAQY
jgi:protocatechuate 3,4-dioxygenase beta subunit